ncbi:MAG: hypothetical protein ACRCY3_07215 [Sphingorhabdus sp.]
MSRAMVQYGSAPDLIVARLKPDEILLWSASPDMRHAHIPWLRLIPAGLFLGASVLLVYTGIMTTAKAVERQGVSGYGGLLIVALAIPFIVAGVSLLRNLLTIRAQVAHEVYALTNRRLMIVNSHYRQDFREIGLDAVCGIQRWDRKDGFAAFEIEDNRQANVELVFRVFLFDGIAHADDFEELVSRMTGVPVTSKRNAQAQRRVQGHGANAKLPMV